MSREVQIITWCDVCLAQNERTEGGEYPGLNSAGVRVTIDLCEDHAMTLLVPAVDALDRFGRAEGKPAKAPKATKEPKERSTSRRHTTPPDGPCPECGNEFASTQSLGMHRWRKHGVPSVHRNKTDAVA